MSEKTSDANEHRLHDCTLNSRSRLKQREKNQSSDYYREAVFTRTAKGQLGNRYVLG